jgi:2-keto-4-pentenoate hydratase/2-oxohepta-3-ene-1,7-dioic acid hydratase in catechol pathway
MTHFASFTAADKLYFGIVTDAGAMSMNSAFPQFSSLQDVVVAGALKDLAKAAVGRAIDFKLDEIQYELPIAQPEKIICVGVNFPERNAEYKDGVEAPSNMSLFPRFVRSFTSANTPLLRPPESEKLDYEGEIAIVIGKQGRRIPHDQAYEHIAAITLCNEGTIRDWVRHAKFNVTQGKNWESSGAMGPWLVPFTHPSQLDDIRITTHVNGELRQDDRTSRMLFSIKRQIEYISTFTTLMPGDIIISGTPTGAGARLDPPQFLKPGDIVEVRAEGIGTLTNTIADEHP